VNVDKRILTTLTALGALLIVLSLVAIPFKGTDAEPAASGEAQQGGGGGGGGGADAVSIKGFKYAPPQATVKAGSKVTFTNDDGAPHTATDTATGAFDTGTLNRGQSKAVTLQQPGTINYVCELHPFMKGTLTVE